MTLENVIYMNRINDISFVIDGKFIVLIEHQSTINNNMPLRMLSYISRNYEKLCPKKSIYYEEMIKIPKPEFVVLYNGKKEMPDKTELKLSDMYEDIDGEINLELKVKVFNINKGHNPEFAKRSSTLDEYETFVDMIYEYNKTMSFEDAVHKAIRDCSNRGVLVKFLRKYSSEVENMLFEKWDLKEALKVRENEGMARGRVMGIKEGMVRGIEQGVMKGRKETARKLKARGMSVDEIAELTGLFVDDILRL